MASALVVLFAAGSAWADDARIGFGTADISPPYGFRRAGSYEEAFGTGCADPLMAKAIYFADGDAAAILVVCDVCGHARDLTDRIRAEASAATGVPAAHIAVTATHTHGGPMHYDPVFRELFGPQQKVPDGADEGAIRGYRDTFVKRCAAAAEAAKKAAVPATIEVGSASAPGLAFNRRYHMKDGSVRFNPGKKAPGIVRAAGPTDDAFPIVVAIDSGAGRPIGSLSSFAMHVAVYGGPPFSADYPGHLQRALRSTYGNGFVSVFGEGCAGDVNHVDVTTSEMDPSPEAIGAALAERFAKAARATMPMALGVKAGVARIPLRPDRPNDLARSRDLLVGEGRKAAEFLQQVEAYQILLTHQLRASRGDAIAVDLLAIRLGDGAAVVTLPFEVFVEIGLDIKARSPFRHTQVITIANEVDCYVPTRRAFGEGSYEVTNSPFLPGAGEILADEAVRLLKALEK